MTVLTQSIFKFSFLLTNGIFIFLNECCCAISNLSVFVTCVDKCLSAHQSHTISVFCSYQITQKVSLRVTWSVYIQNRQCIQWSGSTLASNAQMMVSCSNLLKTCVLGIVYLIKFPKYESMEKEGKLSQNHPCLLFLFKAKHIPW